MYHNMPAKGLYYFIKEAEFCFLMKNKTYQELLKIIKNFIKYSYDELDYDFNNIEDLNILN